MRGTNPEQKYTAEAPGRSGSATNSQGTRFVTFAFHSRITGTYLDRFRRLRNERLFVCGCRECRWSGPSVSARAEERKNGREGKERRKEGKVTNLCLTLTCDGKFTYTDFLDLPSKFW